MKTKTELQNVVLEQERSSKAARSFMERSVAVT